jgi:hypothetical protein
MVHRPATTRRGEHVIGTLVAGMVKPGAYRHTSGALALANALPLVGPR